MTCKQEFKQFTVLEDKSLKTAQKLAICNYLFIDLCQDIVNTKASFNRKDVRLHNLDG